VSSKNLILDGDPDPQWEGAFLIGHVPAHCKVPLHESAVYIARLLLLANVPA